MRLDRFLCELNIGTRSQVRTLIRQNTVTVNGAPAVSPEQKINELEDTIAFRGKILRYRAYAYYMMNKPAGVITATRDAREQTVLDILKSYLKDEDAGRELVPAGRLDKDTEGLLLLTDDGALVHELLSPGKHVEKTYLAELAEPLSDAAVSLLEQGVDIGEKRLTAPARVERLSDTTIYLTIHEGKFHQVKRMLQAVQNEVTALKRVRFGNLSLDDSLAPGECRELTEAEINSLKMNVLNSEKKSDKLHVSADAPKTFLPVCAKDMEERGIEQLDFVYVIGDAYVDHPSFGHAIISRVLEAHGYRVGIISQPDWRDDKSVTVLGRPRLAFLVSAGNMDSMVNHYTVSKKHRSTDAYTPGGEMGKRPDRASVVYGNLIRKSYKDVPIILGGIEASLRRLAHYDYWSDSFKHSVLLDSQADLISYGMGERSIVEIADALASGLSVKDICFIPGTVYKTKDISGVYEGITLPSYEEMLQDKKLYAKSFKIQYDNTDPRTGRPLVEAYPNGVYIVQNPPQPPLSELEMDDVYALPYTRTYHPSYEEKGGVPAVKEVQFSLISNRGCFGGCSFCALTFHQGRTVQTRSHASILEEARLLTQDPDFKGYIHDVGGPTANFRHPSCEKQLTRGVCKDRQCLFPKPCPNLKADHSDYLALLRALRALPGVKKVFVRSGIRFDYLLADPDDTFFRELVKYHVSGQLKVAPEHISDTVLRRMGKPENAVYEKFVAKYKSLCQKAGKDQFLVPYLMSSHPGSTLKEAIAVAEYLRDLGYMPEQVQDFYPTPSTLSTVMYYTGIDPRDSSRVYVCRSSHEKAMQRALIQYRDPKSYDLVREALVQAHREDLIGYGPKCLIRPTKPHAGAEQKQQKETQPGKTRKPGRNTQSEKTRTPGKNRKSERNAAPGKSGHAAQTKKIKRRPT